jgi:D-alanine-D-alanine ligase
MTAAFHTSVMPRVIRDPRDFGRVGLVIGGTSAEREVSLNGGKAVAAALARNHINFQEYDGALAVLEAASRGDVDRVFNLLHGPDGEDGSLQGALQLLNIPVTGANLGSSALTMDKIRSKWVWERNGIFTPPFEYFGPDDHDFDRALQKFGLPLFVKPTGLGSSIGISRVTSEGAIHDAVELARQYGDTILMEPEISGNEYFAGVVDRLALPLIRVETNRDFYDYEAKYESDDTRYFCPCGLPAEKERELQELSFLAYDLLGVTGWGRVDFLLDDTGTPWFLEINTTPGMTDHSLVPQAAAEIGMDFDGLIWRILETSL